MNMVRIPFVGVLALAVIGLAAAMARGDLRFAQSVVNLGEVRTGLPLAHRFPFVNRGTHSVEILDVRTSCGCLTPRLAQHCYEPGEAGELPVEINTLSQAPGPHTWSIRLQYSTEGVVHDLTLQLQAQLRTEVLVQPAALVVFADRAAGHEIVVTDLRSRPLSIVTVRSSSAMLQPRLAEPAQDLQGHWQRQIRLEVADDYPEGRHDEVLALYTDDPDYPELKVPVTILKRLPQRFSATPAEVSLTAPAGQPIPSRIVLIRDKDNESVTVDRVVADDPAIACRWAPGPNTMATVKITVDRRRLYGSSLHSAVHVHLSKPVAETLTIPVTCTLP